MNMQLLDQLRPAQVEAVQVFLEEVAATLQAMKVHKKFEGKKAKLEDFMLDFEDSTNGYDFSLALRRGETEILLACARMKYQGGLSEQADRLEKAFKAFSSVGLF